jgi:hypothetical protein
MVPRARRRLSRWAWLAPALWLLAGTSSAELPAALTPAEPPSAFAVPERLRYAISWAGLPVGESTLVVQDLVEAAGGPVYHFSSTARSNHVLRLLYPVRTRIDSYVDAERFLPIRYTMTGRQGFRVRDRELRFDQFNHSVELIMDGRARVYPTVDAVQDPLSALYYYRRTARMTPGEVVRIPVHDRKRPKEIAVTAGPVESIATDIGTFQAVRLKIKQEEEGIFLHEGDITLWMSADEHRLPLRMEGRVTIGTVVAELTAVTRGAPP